MITDRKLQINKLKAKDGGAVVYIMSRDQRVHDNHALLEAQKAATEAELPLLVSFNLLNRNGVRAREHFEFMLAGLKEVESELKSLNISFTITFGDPVNEITKLANQVEAASIYFDFNPLNGVRSNQKEIASRLNCPAFVVDTHNIIPLWVLSDKEEYAAHTIRGKVHKNLEKWLVEPEKIKKHAYKSEFAAADWLRAEKQVKTVESCGINIGFESGEEAAKLALKKFITDRLSDYAINRNVPTMDGQSELSQYLHFGQISALRVALEVISSMDEPPLLFKVGKLASFEGDHTHSDSANAFLEELIVRKELADNYCFYNQSYYRLEGAKEWAIESLIQHEKDDREYLYSRDQWDKAQTHDEPWNAAQRQLRKTGKIHGYMRMYWAKKILEWSKSPQEAIETAIYLNDHYSIDGGDPNGYVGIMWSIAGVHDRPWFEREVYGKIRYMNETGLKKRFDVKEYIKQWS